MLERKVAVAVIVTVFASLSFLARAALATSSISPLLCTNNFNSATSSDSSMYVKAIAGGCSNGTNSASVTWEAYTGGTNAYTGYVGYACSTHVYVSSALDYWFGSASYGSGCDSQSGYNYVFGSAHSYSFPGGSGGITTSITGWSGNCAQGSSSCTASTSASHS
jgi:hypothetical protein